PAATRDHTERLLAVMGADIAVAPHEIRVRPGALRPIERFAVPGDFSAAFFFLAAGATLPGCDVALTGVGVNPTRTAALAVLRRMGASIDSAREREVHGEPVADIIVRGGAGLTPFEIGHDVVPALIDEIPALCAVAASAHGTSSVRGAAELRGKESDRIATTAALLRAFGVRVDEHPDGIDVHGPARLGAPAAIDTHGDHRIGMSAAVLACAARAPIVIDGARCIATSFPGFDAAWRKAFGG
ncbi:MAG TPA: hypothetical protein VEJ20_09070, partial [Candidatus Eremiobacteraceae bacterium]|nr:hypothetical protein [Candidatus Eremiobacteraceae bacterium]